ncbi:MAG TPA: hypothetical protein DCQ41_00145 [Cryomorphaceae bacterium]|nr:hypothetical protein [Cryomorphaceae bacterium]|tara:strand:- start:3187 stop:4062 length:876 start_codon:yes stop_codon:yes gene_type:complete
MKWGTIILGTLLSITALGQEDDLFALMEIPESTQITYATFKGTKIINAQSNETPGEGVLQYIISHRFGSFSNDYFYNFLGLDIAQIRMQLDYGITDRLNVGIGRSSYLKVIDGFVKYKLLRQKSGAEPFPFSLTLYSSTFYRGARFSDGIDHYLSDRLSYHNQAIFAHKFGEKLSLLVAPSAVHWNLVPGASDPNTTFHLQMGGRYKLTNRLALTGEICPGSNLEYSDGSRFYRPFAIGVDLETGGHVFQFHLSNTNAMSDPLWMAQNPYNPWDGSIFLGFNISRVFTVKD